MKIQTLKLPVINECYDDAENRRIKVTDIMSVPGVNKFVVQYHYLDANGKWIPSDRYNGLSKVYRVKYLEEFFDELVPQVAVPEVSQ